MNKFKLIVGIVLLTLLTSFAWVKFAGAQTFQAGTNVNISQNQNIDSTVYAAGRTVDVSSEVNGDVYCAGMTVNITGTIHGDVICAGQTINLLGAVDGNIRLAGQTITVGSVVSGNATIAGQTFNLGSAGKINGDITMGTTDATLNGPVGRDMVFGGKNLIITNLVGRNVNAAANRIEITSTAQIKGNVNYKSNNEAEVSNKAQIGGKITQTIPTPSKSHVGATLFGFAVAWFIFSLIAMVVTAIVLALLMPRVFHEVTEGIMSGPWKALLTGFLASVAMPFIIVLLAITVIGLPLAFMAGLIWLVVLLFSGPVFAYYIGRLVLRDSSKPVLIMLVGTSILVVLYFIPFIGCIALLATVWVGSGAILSELFKRMPNPTLSLPKNTSGKVSKK